METTGKLYGRLNLASVENLTDVLKRPEELSYVKNFRIATYNVYNLFGKDPDVHAAKPERPASKEQQKALGAMIRDLDADAIAFQEVQNEKVLKDLFKQYVNPSLRRKDEEPFNTFVCIPARDPRGINVALATRLAVRGTITLHDYEFGPIEESATRFSRDLLGVEVFVTPKYRFLFFVAHLKSKIGGPSAQSRREIQAQEIRKLLEEPGLFGGSPYIKQDLILAGDMNDDPDSETIETLRGGARHPRLTDVLGDLKPNFTYPTHGRYKKTRLDFIFASPTMARNIDLDEREIHRNERAVEASDHFPASVTINVPR
jgi:endonuclease/exonuclease/phosphatase family metal-dependent hydrolase